MNLFAILRALQSLLAKRTLKQEDQQRFDVIKKIKKIRPSLYEINMLQGIIEMSNVSARNIMIPRVDVFSINLLNKTSALLNILHNTTYSRLPVYNENIDNIKGIIHVKDLFKLLLEQNGNKKINLIKSVSDPVYIPESRKITDALKDFQENKIHMAIVVDEYGGFSGIITMEDILEEIIGDIQDEFDAEQKPIKRIDKNLYSVDARTELKTINAVFDLRLPLEEVDTIGGFVINQIGYIPKINEIFNYPPVKFKILSKRKNSITRLTMRLKDNHEREIKNQSKQL